MLSAGLSLLESVNSATSASPTTPKLDVLLSHPSMTTKGGSHSPPPARKAPKGMKPTFSQTLRDNEVEVGDRGEFTAILKGDPQPLVTWFADSKPIRSGCGYRYVKDGDRHILSIPKVHNECSVTCKAVNRLGETSSTARLLIREKTRDAARTDDVTGAADSGIATKKKTTMPDEDLTIEVDDVTDPNTTAIMSSIEEKRSTLSAMEFEESAITVLDRSSFGAKSLSINQTVTTDGLFPRLNDISFAQDESCSSKRAEKFVHFSDESFLQEYTVGSSDSSEICSETSSMLNFKHVIVNHDFDWTEEVRRLIREEIDRREHDRSLEESQEKSKADDFEKEACNEVHPPKFTKPICDCLVTAGETGHFVYLLDSISPTAITWHRNGVEVTRSGENPNIGIIEDDAAGCLLISNAEQKDTGVYTCTAENIHGSARCFARLVVTPNLSKTSRSTSTFEEHAFVVKEKAEFKDQISQTISVKTRNKAVSSESATEPPREINDDETGEGGRHRSASERHLITAPGNAISILSHLYPSSQQALFISVAKRDHPVLLCRCAAG